LVAFVFVLLFYVTALGFGMTIAQSVTQEKESRIVEILAAAVPVRSLLWGKIVGNSLLAIGQVVLLVGTGAAALLLTGNAHVLTVVGGAMVWYLVFFVLGFGALACLWSVAGALASRQQDLQATTTPGQVLLFAPYILAVVAGEGVKTVVSMLPIVSAMMMPSRMAEGPVPAWQIAVAIAATIVAAVLLVRVGVRAFEHTVLRTGRRIGYREALAGVRDG
jgi:ABC-2 type transport system permease protein